MENRLKIAVLLTLICVYLIWKLTKDIYRKEYGKSQWAASLFYWQFVVYTAAGVAYLIMFVFKGVVN